MKDNEQYSLSVSWILKECNIAMKAAQREVINRLDAINKNEQLPVGIFICLTVNIFKLN